MMKDPDYDSLRILAKYLRKALTPKTFDEIKAEEKRLQDQLRNDDEKQKALRNIKSMKSEIKARRRARIKNFFRRFK